MTPPSLAIKIALFAVEVSKNSVELPEQLLMKVPWAALELSKNSILPAVSGSEVVVKTVRSPAVALFVNWITPGGPKPYPPLATKFCMISELLLIPTPLIRKVEGNEPKLIAVIVNGLAPALNIMALTSKVPSSRSTLVILEAANVAVSPGPKGIVAGVQLEAMNQRPLAGLRFHVALPPKDVTDVISSHTSMDKSIRRPRFLDAPFVFADWM